MDDKKNIDKAKEIINSYATDLENWLKDAQKIRITEPYVQKAYENAIWQRDSLDAIPGDAPDVKISLVTGLENTKNIFQSRLPQVLPPEDQYTDVSTFNALSISGSSDTFDYLNEIVPKVSFASQQPIYTQIESYKQLHEKQNRLSDVKNLLIKLNNNLTDELELAYQELQHFKTNTNNIVAPATTLRNVLQHFKGQLLLKARNTEKETTNWSIMANRLVKNGSLGPEYDMLEKQKQKHIQLYDRLSRILKGNLSASNLDMENNFIEVVDHFYTVLSLITL